MAYEDNQVFVASAARGASGNSGAIALGKALNVSVEVDITAQSGTTPTLDLSIEWSMDGVVFAVPQPVDSFTQILGTTPKVIKQFATKAPFFRLVWTLGGTSPNYTFSATRYGVGT
jgi:hypothetical protein